jgi:hypothetical protein
MLYAGQQQQQGSGTYGIGFTLGSKDPFPAADIDKLEFRQSTALRYLAEYHRMGIFVGRSVNVSGGGAYHTQFFVLFAVGQVM